MISWRPGKLGDPGDLGGRRDSKEVRMKKSWMTLAASLTAVVVVMALGTVPAAGQSPASKSATASKAGAIGPRTPWGDPDLQGTWSGDSAQAIPMQRPAQFAGRADLTDEEFKAKVDRDTATRKRALNAA